MSMEDKEVLDMANGIKREQYKDMPCVNAGEGKQKRPLWYYREFRRMFSEVSGWTGFGAVVLTCMLVGVAPMWLATPVFTGCFAWVAVRLDRYFRG